jgi:hypothetical protein
MEDGHGSSLPKKKNEDMVRENTTGGSSIITMHSRRIPFPPQEETETKCAASRRASVVVHGSMRSPRGDQRVFVSAQAHSGSCSPKVVRPGPGQERRDGDCQACGTQLGTRVYLCGHLSFHGWATRCPAGLLFTLSPRISNKAVCGLGPVASLLVFQ